MTDSNKFKAQGLVPKSDLAAWLRSLADGEPVFGGEALPTGEFRSLKIALKDLGEAYKAKVSVKFSSPGEPDAPGDDAEGEDRLDSPSYKSLKKHMKQTFKAIGQALAAGNLPPELETVSFLSDARLMVSYPDKGDPFYPAFIEQVEAFESALINQDLEAIRAAYQGLDRLKKDCHERHA